MNDSKNELTAVGTIKQMIERPQISLPLGDVNHPMVDLSVDVRSFAL